MVKTKKLLKSLYFEENYIPYQFYLRLEEIEIIRRKRIKNEENFSKNEENFQINCLYFKNSFCEFRRELCKYANVFNQKFTIEYFKQHECCYIDSQFYVEIPYPNILQKNLCFTSKILL